MMDYFRAYIRESGISAQELGLFTTRTLPDMGLASATCERHQISTKIERKDNGGNYQLHGPTNGENRASPSSSSGRWATAAATHLYLVLPAPEHRGTHSRNPRSRATLDLFSSSSLWDLSTTTGPSILTGNERVGILTVLSCSNGWIIASKGLLFTSWVMDIPYHGLRQFPISRVS